MPYDRDEVLSRTDLAALADEVLGDRRGRGRSATWPCPAPDHGSQTGRTPPVSIFRPPSGQERWRCHACGAGGTAADLVMVTQRVGFADAIGLLASRAGVSTHDDRLAPMRRPPQPSRRPPEPVVASGAIEVHVGACEAYLWSPPGAPMRRWLAGRGLGEEVLRVNRVGADPGPRTLPRPTGLPRRGPAVILPVLGPDGAAVYLQARYLHPPAGRKYDNPTTALAGPSPRLAEMRLSSPPGDQATVLVCEGMPDALVGAQAGHRAAAVLGAGLPDERVARALVGRFPTERLVVAFDADERGRAGSIRLAELLEGVGAGPRTALVDVPVAGGDLNGWVLRSRDAFGGELTTAVEQARPHLDRAGPAPIPAGLRELLDAVHRRHVLVDDPVLGSRNLATLHRTVARWERGQPGPAAPEYSPRRSRLGKDLEIIETRYLRSVEGTDVASTVGHVRAAVAGWSSGPTGPGTARDRWLEVALRGRAADGVEASGRGPSMETGLAIER